MQISSKKTFCVERGMWGPGHKHTLLFRKEFPGMRHEMNRSSIGREAKIKHTTGRTQSATILVADADE